MSKEMEDQMAYLEGQLFYLQGMLAQVFNQLTSAQRDAARVSMGQRGRPVGAKSLGFSHAMASFEKETR